MKINYLLIAFISYVISFVIYLFMPRRLLSIHLDPGNLHVHHFTYGIIILAVGYYLSIISEKPRAKFILTIFYGFGLFLVADETELWLWLKPSMDDSVKFRQLPGFIVMAIFPVIMAAKYLFKKYKNKIPQ